MDRVSVLQRLADESSSSSDESSSSPSDILSDVSIDFSSSDDDQHVFIYSDENPYETVSSSSDDPVHQVVGNELILITKGNGYCCLCRNVRTILYTDNSRGINIPVQLCRDCIHQVLDQN